MKYIFDFDDVLFKNTALFKEHMFKTIAKAGVPEIEIRKYYLEVRKKEFSLKNLIHTLFDRYNILQKVDDVYTKIMSESPNFINKDLVENIKKIGKDNCFVVTNGEQEFNSDKLKYSGLSYLFNQIYIVPGSKKEIVEKICKKYNKEQILFIDDKQKFLDDFDFLECPNLKTILYKGQNLFF